MLLLLFLLRVFYCYNFRLEIQLRLLRRLYREGLLSDLDYLSQQEKLFVHDDQPPRHYTDIDIPSPLWDRALILVATLLFMLCLLWHCCRDAERRVTENAGLLAQMEHYAARERLTKVHKQ